MRPSCDVNWVAIAERYKDLVYSIPLKWGLSSHDASEVFQNTWTIALSREKAPEDAGMPPWLAAIATLQTRTLIRKRRLPSLSSEDEERVEDDGAPDPADALAEAEEEQAVRDALADLPERDRQLITCLYLCQPPMTYTEVSSRLGLAIGSIGPLRQRAIDRLHERLRRLAG